MQDARVHAWTIASWTFMITVRGHHASHAPHLGQRLLGHAMPIVLNVQLPALLPFLKKHADDGVVLFLPADS